MQFVRSRSLEEDSRVLDDIFSRIRQGDNSVDSLIHFRLASGQPLHTQRISYTVICDEYGKPVKCYGVAQDVTADTAKRDGYNQEQVFFSSFQSRELTNRLRIDLTADKVANYLAREHQTPGLDTNYIIKTANLNEWEEV